MRGFDSFGARPTARLATCAGRLAAFLDGRAARVEGLFAPPLAALGAAFFDAFLARFELLVLLTLVFAALDVLFDAFVAFLVFDAFFVFFAPLAAFATFFDAFDLAMGEPLRPSTAAEDAPVGSGGRACLDRLS